MEKQPANSAYKCCSCVLLSKTAAVLICAMMLFSCGVVNAEQASDDPKSVTSHLTGYSFTLVACASAAAFLLIVIYIVAFCTDCYKSEVSTDFHPATGQSRAAKWGGAGGYTAAVSSDVNDTVLGAGFTDEVILPGQGNNQALPYTMIPSQVPDAQGFRGYGSASVQPEQGLRGYGAGGEGQMAGHGGGGRMEAAGMPQRMPGAHISPVNAPEPEDPPPSYFSATDR